MNAPARSSPMTAAARVRQPTSSATRRSLISIMERSPVEGAGRSLLSRLVGAGADALQELPQLLGGEARALARQYHLAIVGLLLGARLRDLGREVGSDA